MREKEKERTQWGPKQYLRLRGSSLVANPRRVIITRMSERYWVM